MNLGQLPFPFMDDRESSALWINKMVGLPLPRNGVPKTQRKPCSKFPFELQSHELHVILWQIL